MENTEQYTRFEVGGVYRAGFNCSSDSYLEMRIIKRTEKIITAETSEGVRRFRPYVYRGVEQARDGPYRGAPIFSADARCA